MTVAEFINRVGFRVRNEDVDKVNNTISGIKSTATRLLGALGVGLSLTAINGLVEEFTRVNNQIRNATEALGEQKEIQQEIMAAAEATRTSYSNTANVVSMLVKGNSQLFGNVSEAVKFNNAATMLFKSAGKTNEDVASLMEAINKSFQKGYVDSETISQLLERAPEAVALLNKRLGTTSDQLEDMASSGAMKVEDLKMAFMDSYAEIEAGFGNVQYSITDALSVIRSKWGLWLAQTNETLGITNGIGRFMVSAFNKVIGVLDRARNAVTWLADKLGGVDNMFRLIAIAAGVVFAIANISKLSAIKTGLATISKVLSGIQLKTLAIIAVVLILALLIDDFINFMKGNDSVIGTLLANAGVDVDKFRQNILKIWENIKTALAGIWQGIKNVAIPVFQAIWSAIKTVFEAIGNIVKSVAPQFADFVDSLASGNVDTEQWEELGEAIAVIAGIVLGIIAVMKVFAAVQAIVNAVMMASPITWIILAIVALIAIIVLLVKNWDKVKAVFLAAWDAIKAAWGKVVDFFKGIWDGIVGVFSAVGTWFSNLFQNAWNGIVSVWSAVIGWFQGIWSGITGVFSSVVSWFTGIFTQAWEGIKSVFSTVGEFFQGVWNTIVSLFTTIGTAVGDAISGAVKGAINAVLSGAVSIINGFISAINFAIGVINAIPGVEIPKLDMLEAPQLAQGGFVRPNKPQAVVIGDNKHEGEIVSPISKMRDTVLNALEMFAGSTKPKASTELLSTVTSSRSVVQNVNIQNTFNGDKAVQQKAATAMDKSARDVTAELARGLAYAR
ncbi:tape measure protein [Flintibacter porci]|uniref:tape measure protein n=1 Tax=Flintibacter porci TaxID=3342383 RepID=UPI003F8BEB99